MKASFTAFLFLSILACKNEPTEGNKLKFHKPKVEQGTVTFAEESDASYFTTQKSQVADLQADFSVPARIVATVIASDENPKERLILFENPELTSNYTLFRQHLTNTEQLENVIIKQRMIELDRVVDLQKHGAATGRDVLEAQTALALQQTNLANEKAALLEHETILKLAGFSTVALKKAKPNTVWVISEIADNLINKVVVGAPCDLTFSSFPNETFKGRIDDIGDVVDNVTRLLKLRVTIVNPDRRLKAGMFGSTHFNLAGGTLLVVPLDALVTVQGKNYVFVKTSPVIFERRSVTIGQQYKQGVTILDGLHPGDEVVIHGTMQLKGLVFGY